MRNIFKLSLAALLVGLPASAFAVDSALPVQLVGTETDGEYTVESSNNLATTSYVQGAYNVLGEAINELDVYAGNIDSSVSELRITAGNNKTNIETLQGSVATNTTNITNLTNKVDALEIPDQGTGTVNVVKSWGGDSEEMDVTVDLSTSSTTGSGTGNGNQ